MPLHKLPPRLRLYSGGENPQRFSMQRIVFPTVLPLLPDSATHLDAMIRCDGDETSIEEEMEVASEEETVADVVGT